MKYQLIILQIPGTLSVGLGVVAYALTDQTLGLLVFGSSLVLGHIATSVAAILTKASVANDLKTQLEKET